jgi:peroxiredoxin
VELREILSDVPDLRIVWVMADRQINERTRVFIDESGLRDHILFLSDEDSALIRSLGILNAAPEPIEEGVPHPATYILDREGIVRFVDVRKDFHIWLAPELIREELLALR